MNRCAKIGSDLSRKSGVDHVEKTFFVNSSGNLCCMGSGGIAVDVIGNAPNHSSVNSLILLCKQVILS